MKVSGIVCEYNPFHNGHRYHIQKTRENGATHIVAVMSGNFVQRGDVAVIDKFERAKAAVRSGVDLIELPVAYSLSSSEGFARGAMYILNSMGCIDELSFGSECGDINKLLTAVQASISCSQSQELKALLDSGSSYPSAMHLLAEKKYGKQVGDIFDSPNNLLAIEYIKAISYLNSKITPFTIARKHAGHDQPEVICNFASASFIRQNVKEQNAYSDLMPETMYETLLQSVNSGKTASLANLEKAIMYRMRTMTPAQLRDVPDVGQGLEYRIFEARTASTVQQMMEQIKTKRYTMSRIRRIFLNSLLGITKDDLTTPPVYARILAINERGTDILSVAKGKSRIPLSTSLARLSEINAVTKRTAELESLSTDIYNLALDNPGPVGTDYRAKIGVTG